MLAIGAHRFVFGLTTAIDSGKSVHLARFACEQAEQMYPGGPWAKTYSGATPGATGDTWGVAVTTDAGTGSFVRELDRTLLLRDNGLAFPTASSEDIANSLIT